MCDAVPPGVYDRYQSHITPRDSRFCPHWTNDRPWTVHDHHQYHHQYLTPCAPLPGAATGHAGRGRPRTPDVDLRSVRAGGSFAGSCAHGTAFGSTRAPERIALAGIPGAEDARCPCPADRPRPAGRERVGYRVAATIAGAAQQAEQLPVPAASSRILTPGATA